MRIEAALLFILVIDAFLFMSQLSVIGIADLAAQPAPDFYNFDNSYISQFDAGNYTLSENPSDTLPLAQQNEGIFESVITAITDMFVTLKNWIISTVPGAKYFVMIINGVPNILKTIGLPIAMAYALGAIWHAISLWLFISWLRGN